MFLSILNEDEKIKSLALLYHVANADGNISESEVVRLGAYATEMGIENVIPDNLTLNEVTDFLASRTDVVKKAVLAEAIGLTYADGVFCEAEQSLIKGLTKSFGLEESWTQEVIDWIGKITPIYAKGFELVGLI